MPPASRSLDASFISAFSFEIFFQLFFTSFQSFFFFLLFVIFLFVVKNIFTLLRFDFFSSFHLSGPSVLSHHLIRSGSKNITKKSKTLLRFVYIR